jgi:hypothetical protein
MLTLACLMLCVGTLGFWWRSNDFVDTLCLGSVNLWTMDGKVALVVPPPNSTTAEMSTFQWMSRPRPKTASLDWPSFRYHPATKDPVTGRATAAGFVVPIWFVTVLLVLPVVANAHFQHRRNLRREID